jgi:hypothetical protein
VNAGQTPAYDLWVESVTQQLPYPLPRHFTFEALCKSRNSLILWGSPRRRFADVAP